MYPSDADADADATRPRPIEAYYAEEASADDIAYYIWIDGEAGIEAWDELRWRTALELVKDKRLYILTVWQGDGTLSRGQAELVPVRRVGYIVYQYRPGPWIEVRRLVVHPAFRRGGIGHYMLNRGKLRSNGQPLRYYARVAEADLDTLRFMKASGWRAVPVRERYVDDEGMIRFNRPVE